MYFSDLFYICHSILFPLHFTWVQATLITVFVLLYLKYLSKMLVTRGTLYVFFSDSPFAYTTIFYSPCIYLDIYSNCHCIVLYLCWQLLNHCYICNYLSKTLICLRVVIVLTLHQSILFPFAIYLCK